jgi:hypothetical protein
MGSKCHMLLQGYITDGRKVKSYSKTIAVNAIFDAIHRT